MSLVLLKGAPVADAIDMKSMESVRQLRGRGISPCLAIVRVGDRADDIAYEKSAIKRAEKVGVVARLVTLPSDIDEGSLTDHIERLDEDVHGILLFRPLPKGLDERKICDKISATKDIDGITMGSMARVYSGYGDGFAPCTARACMEMLQHYDIDLIGKNVAVIGRSLVIGRPVAMMLMHSDATVTICHSKTVDIKKVTKAADIVIAAMGQAESIDRQYLRDGQIVLDVGINYSDEKQKLVGDINMDDIQDMNLSVTPVPGGVGAVTTAVLVAQVVEAAEKVNS